MNLKYSICLYGVLLMTACSTDDVTNGNSVNDSQLPIVIESSMGQMRSTTESHLTTQGNNQVLVENQNVDLFLDEDVRTGTTATYTGQLLYLKSMPPSGDGTLGTGNFGFFTDAARTAGNEVMRYWPASGNGLYFYAYYPAGVISAPVTHETTTTQTYTVGADQGAADGSQAYDLMFGIPSANPIGTAATNPVARPTATTMTASAVNLHFTHCLSKVVVKIQGDGNGIGNGTTGGPESGENAHKNGFDQFGRDQFTDATITLGGDIRLQADVVPNSGLATAKAGGTTGTMILKNSGVTNVEHNYFCIIPPAQNLTGKTITLSVADGGAKTFTIPTMDALEPSKIYTFCITVGLYSMNITSTVGDWTPAAMNEGTLKY